MINRPSWLRLASMAWLLASCVSSPGSSNVISSASPIVATLKVETATPRPTTPVATATESAATNIPIPTATPIERQAMTTATDTDYQAGFAIISAENVARLSFISKIELSSPAWSMATSPTGADAAVGMSNGALALLQLPNSDASSPHLAMLNDTDGDQPVMSIAYSSSGRSIAASTLAEDQTRIVDSASGLTFDALPFSSKAIAFSVDESTVYYDKQSQVVRRTFNQGELGQPVVFGDGKDGIVCSMAYSPLSSMLIVGYCDFRIEGWLDDGAAVPQRQYLIDNMSDFECESNSCGWVQFNHVRLSLDGRHFLSVIRDDRVGIWDALTGEQVTVLEHEPAPASKMPEDAAFSPDGRLAYVVAGDRIYAFDANSGELLTEVVVPGVDFLLTLGASSDGRFLYVTDDTPALSIWAVKP